MPEVKGKGVTMLHLPEGADTRQMAQPSKGNHGPVQLGWGMGLRGAQETGTTCSTKANGTEKGRGAAVRV